MAKTPLRVVKNTDVFDVEDVGKKPARAKKLDPLFKVYKGSRIAVGSAVGSAWQKKFDAAVAAHKCVTETWDEIIQYYNHSQNKAVDTPRGQFVRGDSSENVIYSNLNIMLPAIYSKDPDITCNSPDEADKPFCKALEALVNALLKRRDKIYAKPKIKKAAGMGLLTNFGVFKIDFTRKDDSREAAQAEFQKLTEALAKAKTQQDVDAIYGEMEALEENMEVLQPSGFSMVNVAPHNLIIDPYAEQSDGLDAGWMIEKTYLNTAFMNAAYTEETTEDSEHAGQRTLRYKPTHKAAFSTDEGSRDDGLGMVFTALGADTNPAEPDDRAAYIATYFTECYYVWDKATRRLMLFQKDDWKWPIWVWDDPLKITRFFPYYIISFGMSTGGTVSVGETAYILDHQDDINDINRQISKIRRTVYDFFYYDSEKIDSKEAEKFVDGLRGRRKSAKRLIGIKGGDGVDISKAIQAIVPPSFQFEALFNKMPSIEATNRITNTNDALRGVQYKTNTNVASVESYQEALRISVGSKVDVIEDTVADLAQSIAEIAIVNFEQEEVEGLIGKQLAAGWQQMSVPAFLSQYSLELVAGSMEKPNSVFKKKEAVQIAQAIGQFAQAAPGATLRVMLKVLEQAFTEVVITPEDWAAIDGEIQATMNKGRTDGAQASESGQQQPRGQNDLATAAQQLPQEVKAQVVQMKKSGTPDAQILQFIQQKVQELGHGQNTQPAAGQRAPAAV